MKKIYCILFAILIIQSTFATHLTSVDAIGIVKANLQEENLPEDCELWIGETSDNKWLIMADPTPLANWSHEVVYFYLPIDYQTTEPNILKTERNGWMPKINMTKVIDGNHIESYGNKPFWPKTVKERNIPEATHQYAIILSGGVCKSMNHHRYWNDCSYIYTTLRKFFNVPKSNIYVSMSDGTDPGEDYEFGDQNLDLDDDNIADIEYAASLNDLESIFQNLQNRLTIEDHLFLYVIDHGGYDYDLDSAYICLWDEEKLYPEQLNEWFDSLNVGSINCVFGQCYSGGFVAPLMKENRIIATACSDDEYSYASSDEHFDSFVDAWVTGLQYPAHKPDGTRPNGDKNNNGAVSMFEAFEYAYLHDEYGVYGMQFEYPMYVDLNRNLANKLHFDSYPESADLIIRDDVYDIGICPNPKNSFNDSPDIWITNSNDETSTSHQNPKFEIIGNEENYIHVRIKNTGIFDYDPNKTKKYLHLNWASAACANKYEGYTGMLTDESGNRLGNAIKSVLINQKIPAGGEAELCVPWKTQNFPQLMNGEPLSILASISNAPYGLAFDVIRKYFRGLSNSNPTINNFENSKIAVKNVFYSETDNSQWSFPFTIIGLDSNKSHYCLELAGGDAIQNFNNVFDKIRVSTTLPSNFTLCENPESITNIENHTSENPNESSNEFIFTESNKQMRYISLDNNQIAKLNFNVISLDNSYTGTIPFTIKLKKYPTEDVIGSYTFYCTLSNGCFTTNANRISVKQLNPTRFNLRAIPVIQQSTAAYVWKDEDGNVLGSEDELTIECSSAKTISLLTTYQESNVWETITITPQIHIKGIYRTSDTSLSIKLSTCPSGNTQISVTSVQRPYLNKTIPTDKNYDVIDTSICEFGNDSLIVTLTEQGVVRSSMRVI